MVAVRDVEARRKQNKYETICAFGGVQSVLYHKYVVMDG